MTFPNIDHTAHPAVNEPQPVNAPLPPDSAPAPAPTLETFRLDDDRLDEVRP